MRSLLENSALQRSVLFALIIISFFIGVMLFVNHNQEKRYLPHMLVDVVFLVISYLEFNTVVITMAHVFGDKVITGWRMELAQKPFVLYLAAAVVITVNQVLRIQEDNKWRRNHLSLSSVKESIDLMPYGICYYYESGMPRLINKEMQQISIDIFGEMISNAADFWDNINQKKLTVNARRLEESEIPTWICDEKKVWSFSREKISFEKGYLYEILATDITEEYEMNQRLAKENERVKVLSGKLKEYSQNVTRLTIEKEVLEAKIRIHAELGQTLVATRRYLAAKDIDRAEMLRMWKKNISLLKKEDTDISKSDYELLKINAEQLGISLSLPEELPTDAETKDLNCNSNFHTDKFEYS